MATYTMTCEELGNNDVIERLKLNELHLYGSSRIGLIQDDAVLYQRNMTVNSYDMGWITNYTSYNVQVIQPGPADEKSVVLHYTVSATDPISSCDSSSQAKSRFC
jgi:hypothetical protein